MNCLAQTGLEIWGPLGGAAAVIAIGTIALLAFRRRGRSAGAALGLVVALVLGGGLLATSGTTSAQAATPCPASATPPPVTDPAIPSAPPTTPPTTAPPAIPSTIDLTPRITVSPSILQSGDTTTLALQVYNLSDDQEAVGPIVARIPKSPFITPIVATTANWSVDTTSDPANYVFTYTGSVAAASGSIEGEFDTTWVSNSNGNYQFIVTLDQGTAGDIDASNDSDSETITYFGSPA
ncbi:hypothetical protein QCD70_17920 [Agreia sp. PsM10]|uniref:hypothetical protein n=1 Tax=Agreia sp. PsM10 TaxID=3030533 RepID=UPI00263B178F|nr:hypothetical protein [Agreia sp. PsM10]MDN4642128.1 hypothetical protein [Agreia sp. PsM10]